MIRVTDEQIRWFRQRRSGLVTGFASPEEACASIGGVQAQILSAATLAVWNRSAAGAETAETLADRLFEQRTLIRLWGQRHTLHLYASADWPVIHAAFSERRTWWEREAAKGAPIDLAVYREGVAQIAVLLRDRGTLSRRDLRQCGIDLPPALLSPWGGVFAELVRQGIACLARWEGGEARYAHREHWLPGTKQVTKTTAVARRELARRYFNCYGPASPADFAYWMGLPGKAVAGALPGNLVEVETENAGRRKLLVPAAAVDALLESPPEPALWPVRLLGRFDPLLLGHRDKEWVVPAPFYDRVWRPAGHIEGVVLDQGRAVAIWRYDRTSRGKMNVDVYPFRARLPVRVSQAIRRQARSVAGFFGLKLGVVEAHREPPALKRRSAGAASDP